MTKKKQHKPKAVKRPQTPAGTDNQNGRKVKATRCKHQSHDIVTTIFKARRILRVVLHFNLSVLANETLLVSLCREIDNVFGAVRKCFDHVLSKFSGYSWERILRVSIW